MKGGASYTMQAQVSIKCAVVGHCTVREVDPGNNRWMYAKQKINRGEYTADQQLNRQGK